MTVTTSTRPAARTGTFGNGMPYLRWGDGPRSLVFLQGGPGSVVPSPRMLGMWGGMLRPYVDAGYTVWVLCRRRHMPDGHAISDMADDVADVIRDELGGRVDAVVGLSYGGLIAQYLAAGHPDRVGSVALVGSGACEIPDWATDADSRFAEAATRGDHTGVGLVMAEYLVPGRRLGGLRRLLAPLLGRVPGLASELIGKDVPPEDLLVEARAERAFDSRPVLPRISAPVLILARRERPIPPAVVAETARLIPNCTVIRYRGRGHLGYAFSRQVPRDVLAFLGAQERNGPPSTVLSPGHRPVSPNSAPRREGTSTMTMHSRTVHVDAPVEKVFDRVKDVDHFMAAMRAIDEDLAVANVTSTPEGVGSSARWKSRVFGIPITATLTCEECVTDQRVVYRSSTGPVWTLTVTPDESGTTMGLEFEYHSKMPFFATIVDHTAWEPDRDLDQALGRLKAQIET